MAVTKIHRITTTLTKALEYIENYDKTDGTLLVSGYGCTPEVASIEFDQVRGNAFKPGGTLAFHLIQSFAPGETDAGTAHRIGTELADKVLQGKYQYVISTHIDRGHIHNHIIFNSVSFQDFGKFHSTASTYRFIKRQSDMLCIENGLSVIEHPENQGKSHYEHLIDKQGRSWKSKLRQVIDYCILRAKDWDEFLILMEREKYEIKYGKYISFRAEGQERFTRSKTLGDNYTEENIRKRIEGAVVRTAPKAPDIRHSLVIDIENNIKAQQSKGYENWAKKFNLKLVAETVNYLTENNILDVSELDAKITSLSEQHSDKRSRIKSIDKKIKLLEEQIHDIDSYRKSKRVVDAAPKHFGIEKYRHDHESDYIIYAASVKSLKKHFGGSSLPLIKDLRAEQKKLRAEKDKLIRETSSEKPELDELKTMRRNIDIFLGVDDKQQHDRQNKRTDGLE